MSLRVSVVVLVWNGEKYLEACLSALLSQDYANSEIIVVDNASTDGSVATAQKWAPSVRIIRNERNLGFAGGNNVGIQASESDVVVLLNPDTVVQPSWLRVIVETFQDPLIGVVGCKALYMDGQHIQHAGGVIQPGNAFGQHIGNGERDTGQYDRLTDPEYVTGAALGIHRKVLTKIGNLDEQFYPAFYEEVDYCYRARRAGFRVVYQPRAVLHHHETASLPIASFMRTSSYHRNRVRFVLRHWARPELSEFISAESHAVEISLVLDDLVARAKAYWDNVLELFATLTERKRDPTLGGALGKSDSQWLFDSLRNLHAQAIQRVFMLTLDPSGCLRSAAGPLDGASIETERMRTRTGGFLGAMNVSSLQGFSQDLEERYYLREPHFTTKIPVLGPVIDFFYNIWTRLTMRRYVMSVLNQQSAMNAQIVRLLEALQQILISDEAAVIDSIAKRYSQLEDDPA